MSKATPEQQDFCLDKFYQLDKPTQRILLNFMEASRDNDVEAMRAAQQQLPEAHRSIFDSAIASAEAQREVA